MKKTDQQQQKVLHLSWSEVFDYSSNININIKYDSVKLKTVTRSATKNHPGKVTLSPDAYNNRIKTFNNNSLSSMFIYIYILFMILFILFKCVIYSKVNDFNMSESISTNYTIDFPVNNSNKVDIKSYLNTINKSIPNIHDVNKVNQQNINDKYNESTILNKVKDLHLNEMIIECDFYKDKVLQLEMQISNNKVANSNLVKDISDILKEIEYERKKL